MHPVGYLFEEIYRNYWGIAPIVEKEREPAVRTRASLLFRLERRR